MEPDENYFNQQREKTRELYTRQKSIRNPYFQQEIIFNSDGFHHLQFSARRERNRKEQLLKFRMLPFGIEIIKKSGTIQEYRKLLTPIGKKSAGNGAIPMKYVEYWGLVAIVGTKGLKVRAVLRRVGDGNITFWSVMPYSKIKGGVQKLYTEGIEDE